MGHRAVIFDLGGVVFPSPFDVFSAYEADRGLPEGFLRRVVAAGGDHGSWARLERGELRLDEFHAAFAAECEAAGAQVNAAELMAGITRRFAPRSEMVAALRTIRSRDLRTAALTNNWLPPAGGGPADRRAGDLDALGLFDVVVESAREGLRKPDPAIYRLTCDRLGVAPAEAVFLDDLGVNLKPARALGMTTIKVTDPHAALGELAAVLGFPLT